MRIEQLQYLVEVSKNRSISAASEKLHLTSQDLSQSFKNLEIYLDISLLNRTHKGVFLTKEGEKLVQVSQYLFEALAEIKDKKPFFDPTIDICYMTSQEEGGSILPPIICEFYKKYPQAKLDVYKYSREIVIDKILNKEANLAFIYRNVIDDQVVNLESNHLCFFPLIRSRTICQVSKKLGISVYKTISIKTLENIPLIIYHPKNSNNYSMLDVISPYITPKKVIFEDNCVLIKQMVLAGIGATFSIQTNLQDANIFNSKEAVANIPLKENIGSEFGILYHREHVLTDNEEIFINFINDYIKINTAINITSVL